MTRRISAFLGALAVLLALGCAPTLEPNAPDFARGGPNVGKGIVEGAGKAQDQIARLLTCGAQPARKTVKLVGPGGATIWAGNHRLRIPENALSSSVWITMEAPAEQAAVVEFQPHGLTFNPDAAPTLTMSTAGCEVPPVANLGIKYLTPDNVIIESLKSQWNGKSGTIAAPIDHFSRYAVAW